MSDFFRRRKCFSNSAVEYRIMGGKVHGLLSIKIYQSCNSVNADSSYFLVIYGKFSKRQGQCQHPTLLGFGLQVVFLFSYFISWLLLAYHFHIKGERRKV